MSEHPIKQPISRVLVAITPIGEIAYQVGKDGVTCIEPFVKSGMHSDIPYLWIWAKDECLAELCQHNVIEVAFVVDTNTSEESCDE